ncbi:MAG TPA: MerR family DNA-binding transcriptional regulator, partial [Chloroflexota bacterium]|nr:MerR family DNA-binding transcriptional regulator [Chloroflexota bacterium]
MRGRYYTTGRFAQRASVSVRTLRFYDRAGLLEPSER